jgi:hypothetical protein
MKKNTFFVVGMVALLLSFGVVLMGCDNGTNGGGGGGGNPTVKLEKATEDTFTLTLSGTTWKTGVVFDLTLFSNIVAQENWITTGTLVQLDSAERTSDTVVTVTVSTTGPEAGSGTISLRARDGQTAQLYGTAGALFNALVVGDIELDVASDSGTATYTITVAP